MMSSSDRSPDYFSGLLVGFLVLAVFGVATYLMFGAMDLKQPVERTYEGDFSAEVSEQRRRNREMVDQEQAGAFDPAKVSSELDKIKPAPASKSAVVVPGSPTALKAFQPPAEPEVKEEAKAEPAPDPVKSDTAKPEGTPKADSEEPRPVEPKPAAAAEGVPAETPAPRGEAAPGGKSKAKAKGVNGGQADPEVKGKAKGKTKAKAKAAQAKGGAKGKAKSQEPSKAKAEAKAKAKGGNQGKAKAAVPAPVNDESGAGPETGQENGSE